MNGDKILLVEDELFLRDLYIAILQKAGYTVLSAEDGEAGLQLAQNNPDAKLLLLDVMLPKMHGIDVLKRLKADPATRKLPILLLTNLTEENVVKEALRLGAYDYLVKISFSAAELVEKIKECLASQGNNSS